jgi:hypothetical protein
VDRQVRGERGREERKKKKTTKEEISKIQGTDACPAEVVEVECTLVVPEEVKKQN